MASLGLTWALALLVYMVLLMLRGACVQTGREGCQGPPIRDSRESLGCADD
jgi:hypothetical protein